MDKEDETGGDVVTGLQKRRLLQMAVRARQVADGVDETCRDIREPITCTRGCAHCCYQAIFCTAPEAALIYKEHRALVEGMLPALTAQAEAIEALAVHLERPEEITRGAEVMAKICVPWWERHEACVFLDTATNDCRIYSARPVACRAYAVISDPVHCASADPCEVTIVSPDRAMIAEALSWAAQGTPVAMPVSRAVLHARKALR